jgi:hypothetical protein
VCVWGGGGVGDVVYNIQLNHLLGYPSSIIRYITISDKPLCVRYTLLMFNNYSDVPEFSPYIAKDKI